MLTEYLSSSNSSYRSIPLVLLNGWGINKSVWTNLLSELRIHFDVVIMDFPGLGENQLLDFNDLEEFESHIEKALPEACLLVGWSLGGMIATRLAARFPKKVLGLITLATNQSFVEDEFWERAMEVDVFENFYKNFLENPEKTLSRFVSLQAKGDENRKSILSELSDHKIALNSESVLNLTKMLNFLRDIKNYSIMSKLHQPCLCIFGDKDQLVPFESSKSLNRSNQRVLVLKGVGHALPVSSPKSIGDAMNHFVESIVNETKRKKKVSYAFSQAAKKYDEFAHLQKYVAQKLFEKKESYTGIILDLGCGTGWFAERVNKNKSNARVLGIDLSLGMLQTASNKKNYDARWVCADMEKLPISSHSVDCIYSSLSLQWVNYPKSTFSEMFRVLKPKGKIFIATLGPKSLYELREAWEKIDKLNHVNQFFEYEHICDQLTETGFDLLKGEQEQVVLSYGSVIDLMRELKTIGANSLNSERVKGLTTPKKLNDLIKNYEQFRLETDLVPATYEVYYFCGQKGE